MTHYNEPDTSDAPDSWEGKTDFMGGSWRKGKSKKARARHDREQAIKNMIKTWKTGYMKSQGQFRGAQANILGNQKAAMGGVGAAMAASGLSSTTAGAAGARAVGMDTNQSLQSLGRAQAETEYSKWMDLAQIKSNTKWDGTSFQSAPAGPNAFGTVAGGAIGGYFGGPAGATAGAAIGGAI